MASATSLEIQSERTLHRLGISMLLDLKEFVARLSHKLHGTGAFADPKLIQPVAELEAVAMPKDAVAFC